MKPIQLYNTVKPRLTTASLMPSSLLEGQYHEHRFEKSKVKRNIYIN